jgi:integrase
MRLDQLTASDVQRMKADLSQKSAKTVNNILSVLNKMLRVAVDWGVIVTVPVRITLLRTQDTEMTFYEPDVYARLVAAAARRGPSDELLVRLGGDVGLRRGELIGLRGENVDLRRRMISVSHNVVRNIDVDTKGLKIRRVPMSQGLADLLQKHVAGVRGHLICQADGEPVTPKILRRQMAKIELDAGLDGMGQLHILRHTYCSHLAMAGAPVLEIQRLAGHAHLTTTMKYMHLAPNADQRTAVRLLDKLRATVPRNNGEDGNEDYDEGDEDDDDGGDEDDDDDA